MDGSSLQIGCLGPGVEQSALEFLPKRIEKRLKRPDLRDPCISLLYDLAVMPTLCYCVGACVLCYFPCTFGGLWPCKAFRV